MATEIISSGIVSSGGSYYNKNVEIYGTAENIVFQYCYSATVMNGGKAIGTTAGDSSYMKVLSGGIASNTTVYSATMSVSSGGQAHGITFSGPYAGKLYVHGNATNISGNASMSVAGGGVTSNTTLTNIFYVHSDGTAINTTMDLSGTLYVYAGGFVSSSTLLTSAHCVLEGNATDTYLKNEKTSMTIHEGGNASTTHLSAGKMYVSNGGTATDTHISGGVMDVSAGASVNIVKVSAGSMNVLADANVTSTSVLGGVMNVSSGGSVNIVKVSAGSMNVLAGANIISASVLGGIVRISSGAVLTGAVARDGRINVLAGGTAVGNGAVGSGAINVNKGGIISSCTAISSGRINITGGGALLTEIGSGGLLVLEGPLSLEPGIGGKTSTLSQLGIASDTKVSRGGVVSVGSGGAAVNTILAYSSGGGLKPGPVLLDLESKGKELPVLDICGMYINSSGLANGVTASKGGILIVGSKGKLISGTISSGAVATVLAGGIASGLNVFRGASASILGSTSQLVIGNSGLAELANGANVQNTTVSSGGLLRTSAGAVVSGVTVSSGGTITGRYANLGSQTIGFMDGSTLDFDITSLDADAVCVDKLNYGVYGAYACTLTVSGSQADGVYQLAGDAAGFSKTISVVNEDGEALGTLTVGQTVNIGSSGYTLNLNSDDVLSVSVGAVAPGPTPEGIAKSDIDGNGISDVMFVWTGNNYAHGYWMNGTNTWQSANSNHPADWDNLGCHDMTGNGKADSVLFGNVTSEAGIKGAYIGFYTDAIDTPDGSTWVNIGYLTNEDDIQWKNKVGNLTGNEAGVNSIVWYAPELYALGVWKDGKEDWATLSGDFGGDAWTLVGCGDFDGDGKDSVLMTYNDGQMFYAVGLDGTAASLGSTNWSGWEVRAIGDFAGDKKDDIVLFHKATGSMVMCANGNLDSFVSLAQLDAEDWFVVGAGDYNGDSKDDLLVRQYSTGMLGYYSAGNTANWVELGRGVDMNWTVIA